MFFLYFPLFCWPFFMPYQCFSFFFLPLGGPLFSTYAPLFTGSVDWEPGESPLHGLHSHYAAQTAPFIPTSWEALTPSQFLKDALNAPAKADRDSVTSWIKFLTRPLDAFIIIYVLLMASMSLQSVLFTWWHTCRNFFSNIWSLNNESCHYSFIKHQVALSAVQPWLLCRVMHHQHRNDRKYFAFGTITVTSVWSAELCYRSAWHHRQKTKVMWKEKC